MDLKSITVADAIHLAKIWGNRRFRHDPDRETKVADAQSVAWEIGRNCPEAANPASIARYAIRRVAAKRHLSEKVRELAYGKASSANIPKAKRTRLDMTLLSRPGDDPAEIAAIRHDLPILLEPLSERHLNMAIALAMGERGTEVAERFGCSQGLVSQLRRLLYERWVNITA